MQVCNHVGVTNMNYSLGNMLGGSNGSLNADKLSLDLQFATDKTLTARKGPTPTFTRASTATFVGSNGLIQSAAINQARFEHDPVTLASRGLLIEESRTNLILQSEDFGTSWSAVNSTVSANATTSPNGLVTADKLIVNLLSVAGRLSQNTTLTGSHTFSAFLKASEWSWAFITPSAAVGGVWFNLSNGTIGTQQSGCVGSIVSYGNGWYRCSVTLTGTGVASTTRITPTNADNANTAGDGTSGIFAWGAQLEAAAFSTSYIPTTTASVVRSVDLCSISGSNFTGFWNQSAGTLVEAFEASPNTNTTYVSASNGNIVQNSVHLDNDTGLMRAVYYSGSSLVATLDLGSVGTVGTVNTIATAYSVNDFAASRNGGTVVTDTSGAVPASLSQMNIGTDERSQTPTSFYSNRCIKSLRYYKKRLANAKLQTLST